MKNDNWKWWYFVVAGVLITAFGGYQIWDVQIKKGIGGLLLGVLCIAIGLFSRNSEVESEATPDDKP